MRTSKRAAAALSPSPPPPPSSAAAPAAEDEREVERALHRSFRALGDQIRPLEHLAHPANLSPRDCCLEQPTARALESELRGDLLDEGLVVGVEALVEALVLLANGDPSRAAHTRRMRLGREGRRGLAPDRGGRVLEEEAVALRPQRQQPAELARAVQVVSVVRPTRCRCCAGRRRSRGDHLTVASAKSSSIFSARRARA